jgi:hypothetical protein
VQGAAPPLPSGPGQPIARSSATTRGSQWAGSAANASTQRRRRYVHNLLLTSCLPSHVLCKLTYLFAGHKFFTLNKNILKNLIEATNSSSPSRWCEG